MSSRSEFSSKPNYGSMVRVDQRHLYTFKFSIAVDNEPKKRKTWNSENRRSNAEEKDWNVQKMVERKSQKESFIAAKRARQEFPLWWELERRK